MQCEATKANGDRCGANAALGGKLCAGHAGLGIANGQYAKAANARSVANRQRRAIERQRTAKDWIQAELEANASVLVGSVVAKAKDGDWRAFAWLYETMYGKPQEKLELAQPNSIAEVASMSASERKSLRERLLATHPELAELVPLNERTGQVEPNEAIEATYVDKQSQ